MYNLYKAFTDVWTLIWLSKREEGL